MVEMAMSVLVTKADGSKQIFEREKVLRTCLRMGASRRIAEEVAAEVERRVYAGMETRKILQMTLRLLRKHKPAIQHLIDLRRSLSLLRPTPDFEHFVQLVLAENGYDVTPNQIIRGKCVEHEVDGIARKDGITFFVEVKHHYNFHTPTGLDESRIARAVLEDVVDGFELGLNSQRIDKPMIVCNTKFSEHAKRYAACRDILQIGWSSPPSRGLQDLIEAKELHPITCLKGLRTETKKKLTSAGIILLKHLATESPKELGKKIGMTEESLEPIIKKAKSCVYEIFSDR